jgi:hypothetical protein
MNAFMGSVDALVLGRSARRGVCGRRNWSLREPSSRAPGQAHLVDGRRRYHLDEQAIDEFVVSVVPVFIGDGIPLIARRHRQVPLTLQSVERFEDGLVQLH